MDTKNLRQANKEELQKELARLKARYREFQSRGLALDMTRGKPSPEQLDLANEMLLLPGKDNYKAPSGADVRNYGGLDGLPEMKDFFSKILEVPPEQIIVGGNASLALMHDTLWRAVTFGLLGSPPWGELKKAKFLCPVPGYDRHFAATEHFGIEMLPVPMTPEGPDMDEVERLAASDESIKGIWIVPKYSNPTGATCSPRTVERLASMKTAAKDFRIFWDNAYAEHHLYDEAESREHLANIYEACKKGGNEDRVYLFCSTSKISFAGAGVSAMAASPANIADLKKHLALQTIGPDKVNQLRHLYFFKDIEGLRAHMKKHAALLRPRFSKVLEVFEKELSGSGLASWTNPRGGYFISLDVMEGTAARVVALAAEAGVKLTAAGATWPYKKDPKDTNIRIAPSLPSVPEIETAMQVLCLCVKIAGIEKIIEAP